MSYTPKSAYVAKTGDTMTGDLALESPTLASRSVLFRNTGGVGRWSIGKGNSAESGSNAGSNLDINAFNDVGAQVVVANLRRTGIHNIKGEFRVDADPTNNLGIAPKQYVDNLMNSISVGTVTYQSGWANKSGTEVQLLPNGLVFGEGLIKPTSDIALTAGVLVTTANIPVGFRPPTDVHLSCVVNLSGSTPSAGRVAILASDGSVRLYPGLTGTMTTANGWFSIYGLNWFTS